MKGRWEDWVVVVAGAASAVSWVWHGMVGVGMAVLLILGVLSVLAAVISITRPGLIATEVVTLALGVLLFLSPWLLAFIGTMAAAWTAWTAGAVIAVMGIVSLPLANTGHRGAVTR